jgi:predicted peptidase
VEAFRRAGTTDITLTVYPEAGHDSWTETYNNPQFFDWLLSQSR